MTKLALIGGAASFHAKAFSGLVNGLADGQSFPEGWPRYSPCVDGARIVSVWDEDREAAQALAQTFGIENIPDEMMTAAENADAVIITDDLTMQHQKRARPFLERGIPTYVDKPLSPDPVEAAELMALATRTSTPLLSCSALRFAGETEELRAQRTELGEIEIAVASCPGELVHYGIHALELAYSILGSGVVSVRNVGNAERAIVRMEYSDGRALVLLVGPQVPRGFHLSFAANGEWKSVTAKDSIAYYSNLLRQIVKMAKIKKSSVAIEETLEIIRVLNASKRSLQEGEVAINAAE